MGRISRAKAHPRPRPNHDGPDDGRGGRVGTAVPRIGAVADWSDDDRAISPSLRAARARYTASIVGRVGEPHTIRSFAVRLARASGLRLDDIRQLTLHDALALVDDLGGG